MPEDEQFVEAWLRRRPSRLENAKAMSELEVRQQELIEENQKPAQRGRRAIYDAKHARDDQN